MPCVQPVTQAFRSARRDLSRSQICLESTLDGVCTIPQFQYCKVHNSVRASDLGSPLHLSCSMQTSPVDLSLCNNTVAIRPNAYLGRTTGSYLGTILQGRSCQPWHECEPKTPPCGVASDSATLQCSLIVGPPWPSGRPLHGRYQRLARPRSTPGRLCADQGRRPYTVAAEMEGLNDKLEMTSSRCPWHQCNSSRSTYYVRKLPLGMYTHDQLYLTRLCS